MGIYHRRNDGAGAIYRPSPQPPKPKFERRVKAMSQYNQNQSLQNEIIWFPYTGSTLFVNTVRADLHPRDAGQLRLGHRIGMLMLKARDAIKAHFRARAVRRQLLGMDARLLADIGITQADIEAVANGTYQPAAAEVHELQLVLPFEDAATPAQKQAA